jgi:hypothetical protein
MERSSNHAPIVGCVKSGISSGGITLTPVEPGSSCDLFTPDLWRIEFPRSVDMDAQPTPPPVTLSFEAWCQSRTKRSIVDPIYNRSFLLTPVCFHEPEVLAYP